MGETEVLVVGGGLAGVAAALAAARHGAGVLLVERDAFLGSNATTGLSLLSFHDIRGNRVIGGVPEEFVSELRAVGGATDTKYCPLHCSMVIVDDEKVKTLCAALLKHENVRVLLNAVVVSAHVEDRRISEVAISTIGGQRVEAPEIVIDASGDAAAAFMAGAETTYGAPETGKTQPQTLMFRLAGVDTDRIRRELSAGCHQTDVLPRYYLDNERFWVVGFRDRLADAKQAGLVPRDFPMETVIFGTTMREGEVAVNMAKVANADCLQATELAEAEMAARHDIGMLTCFFRQSIPGFSGAYVSSTAHRLGIREGRRVVGHTVLGRRDLVAGLIPEDAIGLGGYMIDVHPASGGAANYVYPRPYGIPYGSLVPKGIDNLLVAGRCISASHEALGSTRVMVVGMAEGEAAGTAAALCCHGDPSLATLDVCELRRHLAEAGVLLRPVKDFEGYSPHVYASN